ncbi:MAG: DUF2993 domain-containing protein [Stenomitos rutilans HA7619-LM2]|jgi:hypothetical protein|nr:DUF2993 domain-containing protein [Stenomitos rutilans HA7619-LM2]
MSNQSRLISKILSPAIRLWLRSQLEHVDDLHLTIEAGDRQLLSGNIKQVSVSARKAVYRGLHLSQVSLVGEQIYTNFAQVLRGKPFRLTQAFPIMGDVLLCEADVNASLQAPLLAQGVIEFLLTLLQADGEQDDPLTGKTPQEIHLQDPQVVLGDGLITLAATLLSASGQPTAVAIRTGFRLSDGNKLHLDRPYWLPHAKARQGMPLRDLDGFAFDLGSEVSLQILSLEPGQIRCQGQIMVTPEE